MHLFVRSCAFPSNVWFALQEVVDACVDSEVFAEDAEHKSDEPLSVILVGPMAKHYGGAVGHFVESYTRNEVKVDFLCEQFVCDAAHVAGHEDATRGRPLQVDG